MEPKWILNGFKEILTFIFTICLIPTKALESLDWQNYLMLISLTIIVI